MKKQDTKQLNIRVPTAFYSQLHQLAETRGTSITDLVVSTLTIQIEKEIRKQKRMGAKTAPILQGITPKLPS